MEIAQAADEVKSIFEQQSSWEERYRQIILFGKKLQNMDDEFKVEKYKVKGCQSQVWLYPQFDGKVISFQADSDSTLVKGIIALLLHVYNNRTPEEIGSFKPDFLEEVGITEHLSMNRTNGLAAMVKQIQMYAFAFGNLLNNKERDS